jgi:Icc-related predicted phosphoesterase
MVKILVVGDLHGAMPRIHFKEFDYVLVTGDICSDDGFRPMYKKWFSLLKKMGDDAPSPEKLMEEMYGKGAEDKFEKNNLDKGRKILERLNSYGVPVLFVPGNWDQSYGKTRIKNVQKSRYNKLRSVMDRWFALRSNRRLLQGFENVYDLQFGLYKDEFVNFIGYGLTNNVDNFREDIRKKGLSDLERKELGESFDKILRRLPKLWKNRNKKVPIIFCSHNMPYGVMDKSLIKKSYAYKKSLGSWVARRFCLKKKPAVCVGGHLHEYYGKRKLGVTTVVNAGFGRDAQVLLDVNEKTGKIRIEFVKSLQERYRKEYGKKSS